MFTLNGRFLITVFGRLRGVSQAAMGGERNVGYRGGLTGSCHSQPSS